MKQTQQIMGMPITIEIADESTTDNILNKIFGYFRQVDEKFSTYKATSEISKINRGEIQPENFGPEMKEIFELSEQTKNETDGYFDIKTPSEIFDPSGLVKGWAIYNAAEILKKEGCKNFYVEAGGDVEAVGKNSDNKPWIVGIRNPFKGDEIVKIVYISDCGMATSGNYIRGNHIYDPHMPNKILDDIVSLTVIGPNVYEADRFATAAFAMGRAGIDFIEKLAGFEGYMIDKDGMATMTTGFTKYSNI
jgi:thiamine biosynthesis lipoprotein